MRSESAVLPGISTYLAVSAAAFFLPLLTLPPGHRVMAYALLALAVLLRLFRLPEASWFAGSGRPLILALCCVALCWIYPSAWWASFGLLALGGLLYATRSPLLLRPADALLKTGFGLAVGLLLVHPAIFLFANLQRDLPAAWAAQWLGRLFQAGASLLGGDLYLATPDENLPFSVALEWTAPLFRLVALGIFLRLLWLHRPRKLLLRLLLYLALFVAWSGLMLLFQYQLGAALKFYEYPWNPLFQVALALPLVLLAYAVAGVRGSSAYAAASAEGPVEQAAGGVSGPAATPGREPTLTPAFRSAGFWSVVLCTGLIAGGLCFHDPGTRKAGRVLIDDGHSDWEWSTEPMNTSQFGTKTTYNYHGMGRLLSRYYDTRITFEPLLPALLDSTDVLILKTPTRAYSDEEQAAILDFVERGGGLYMISDHTDVFGMSTHLNVLAEHFGFSYNKDSVFDLWSTKDQFWKPEDLLVHPAVHHTPYYRYLTGCSIRPGLGCELAMVGPQAGSDLLCYAISNFFDNHYPRTELRFGNLVQTVVAHKGRGRVVGFSDSTTYSNFAMFWPGRLEHLLSIIEYLNRRNSAIPWRLLMMLAGIVALALGTRGRGPSREDLLPGAALALVLVLPLLRGLDRAAYPLPEEQRALPSISVDTLYAELNVPLRTKPEQDDPLNMETFFIWLYRSGKIPVLSAGAIPEHSTMHVLVNPSGRPSAEHREQYRRFMEQGGTLVLAAMPGRLDYGVNAWLDEFGLRFGTRAVRDAIVDSPVHTLPVWVDRALTVEGGEAFYFLEDGCAVATRRDVGTGSLVLSGLADCFNNQHLGRYDSVPSELSFEYLLMYYAHLGMELPGRLEVAGAAEGPGTD